MSNVDLSALQINEQSQAVPKRPIGPRLMVASVCAITITVIATFLVPILWPPRIVTTEAVRSAQISGQNTATTMTEAVGWVEADPFPVIVRPLVSGHNNISPLINFLRTGTAVTVTPPVHQA